jgi:hypothetical protein
MYAVANEILEEGNHTAFISAIVSRVAGAGARSIPRMVLAIAVCCPKSVTKNIASLFFKIHSLHFVRANGFHPLK